VLFKIVITPNFRVFGFKFMLWVPS